MLSAAFMCSVRTAMGACEPLRISSAVVEVVPSECSFWRHAGLVRPLGATARGEDEGDGDISWSIDCGLPVGHREIRFSGSNGSMGVDSSHFADGDPAAVSDMGSQTRLTFRACGSTEAKGLESVYRSWTTSGGSVLQKPSLEYSVSQESDAGWKLTAKRFPVSSHTWDFVIESSSGKDAGDRVARAVLPPDLINPRNRTAAQAGYTGTLCVSRRDGGKGFEAKWNVEFFSSDLAVRRAVVAAVVMKAVRDHRRSPTTGEYVDNECRSTYLANSIGIPITLMALAGVTGLLLGTNILSVIWSACKAWREQQDEDPDAEDAIESVRPAAMSSGELPASLVTSQHRIKNTQVCVVAANPAPGYIYLDIAIYISI